MQNLDYDVIIVGGGPAGVGAAKSAAKEGLKTLLLEKEAAIAAWKPCGEATSEGAFVTAEVKPEPPYIVRKANALVFAPNQKYVAINQEGYAINKTYFLQELAAQVAKYGGDIHVREEFIDFEREGKILKVKTNRNIYRTKIIIGADGYNSSVAKSAGIKEKSEPIPTVQYVMANVKLKHAESVRFYLGNSIAPKGYAWIFPKTDNIAEVGIGVRGATAKVYLDKFVKQHEDELGEARIIDYRGAPVPIGGLISEAAKDNVLLVGDAAGTVIPFTGAGIHSSLAAGIVAGKVAAEAVRDNDYSEAKLRKFYDLYEEPWGKRIRTSLKAMRLFEKISDEDFNALAEVLDENDILDLANGYNVKRVAMKLIRHPILAGKIAASLMSI